MLRNRGAGNMASNYIRLASNLMTLLIAVISLKVLRIVISVFGLIPETSFNVRYIKKGITFKQMFS